jgi:hypothetical protein
MIDLLPFPRLSSSTPEKQIEDLYEYLIQLKEELEFILGNISKENLSSDLLKIIGGIGKQSDDAEVSQASSYGNITFSVNFSNGHLEYATK